MTPDDVRAAAEQLVDFHERFALLFGKVRTDSSSLSPEGVSSATSSPP